MNRKAYKKLVEQHFEQAVQKPTPARKFTSLKKLNKFLNKVIK